MARARQQRQYQRADLDIQLNGIDGSICSIRSAQQQLRSPL